MLRLLIVDDERYIVESLSELFAMQPDMELDILTAYYGDEALHILKHTKVDLVFLDIKMPGMSGINVAREITENWPNCRIIFFTGHASFDYIYEIKNIKNTSFLLKTEDNDTIVAALKQAIAELEEQRSYQQLSSQAEQAQMRLSYLLHSDILRDMLNGRSIIDLKETISRNADSFQFDIGAPLHLLFLKTKQTSSINCNVDFHQHIITLTAYFYHSLNEKYRISLIDTATDTFTLFIQPIPGTVPCMNMNHSTYIHECLNDCLSSTLPVTSCHLLLLFSEKEINWYQVGKTFDFYQQYYINVILPSFTQYDRLIVCKEEELSFPVQNSCFQQFSVPPVYFSRLINGLQTSNLKEVSTVLQDFYGIFSKTNSMHHLSAISLYHKISNIYIDFIMQYHLTEKIALQVGLCRLYDLNQFQSWEELILYYQRISLLLLQTIEKEENDSRKRTISQVKAFIQSNLHRALSLNEIANAVNYNSTYLSRLFHQITGESISQYMLRIKMEKAKNYLTHSNETVQSIAEKLGFVSSQYFSMVFKKYAGLSPRDYRNRSIY